MITYVTGDLFLSPAQVLVNTVNTVGVMGKGVAYEFKGIFPEMFDQYRGLCEAGKLQIGDLWLYRSPNKWILNFPTKKHWRAPSQPNYIEAGLKRFTQIYAQWGIHSIAFPALGCGNGELDFENQVAPLMEYYLSNLPIHVFIYPNRHDQQIPEHRRPAEFRDWLRTQPDALPFTEVWDDIQILLAKQKEYKTVSNGNQFAAILQDGDSIRVEASGHIYIIQKETVFDIWQQLRAFGFSARNIAPSLSRHMSYIIPIFAELPYVKLVRLSRDYTRLETAPIGLQYLPNLKKDGNTVQQLVLPWH